MSRNPAQMWSSCGGSHGSLRSGRAIIGLTGYDQRRPFQRVLRPSLRFTHDNHSDAVGQTVSMSHAIDCTVSRPVAQVGLLGNCRRGSWRRAITLPSV